MTTDNRKVQLEVGLDASGVKQGASEAKQAVREMARDVGQSAQQTGKSIEGMGAGADGAAKKLDGATRSIIASVQRTTAVMEAGERGTSRYFEALASQRGANVEALRPYLSQLEEARRRADAVTGSVGQMGMSTKQTAAALRGVPAQFTDIFTSLASGQQPLTVLLQQGGQLKDMFGGAGAAARALGGYVLGLINPLTVAVGVIGAAGLAYFKGTNEVSEFNKQLVLSGNAAGASVGQLTAVAAAVGGVVGTQGKAAEVIAGLAATGRVSLEQMRGAATGIISINRAAGLSIEELTKNYADLGKAPAESIAKLNEKYNFLTAATYAQIKALEEQGNAEQAAALAQQTYSAMLVERTAAIEKAQGSLERGWKSIKGAAAEAWDVMLGIGREDPLSAQADSLMRAAAVNRQRAAEAEANGRGAGAFGLDYAGEAKKYRDRAAQQEADAKRLREQESVEGKVAQQRAAAQRQESERIAAQKKWAEDKDRYLSRELRLEADIARVREQGKLAGASDKEIADRVAFLQAEKNKKGDAAAAREQRRAESELAKGLGLVDDLSAKQDGFAANYGEQVALLSNALQKGAISVQVYDRAMEQLLQRQPFAIEQTRRLAEAEREFQADRRRRFEEVERQYQQEVRAAEQSAKSVVDRVQAMREEEEAIQRSVQLNITLAEALADVREARLVESRDKALAAGEQERADAISAEIRATRELAGLTDRKKSRDAANDSLKDFLKADIGTDFAAGFDKASQSLGVFVEQFAKLAKAQEEYNKARQSDSLTAVQAAALDQAFADRQLSSYAALAGAAKGFFKEQSDGYKALQVAEQVLRAIEMASSLQRIAAKLAEGQAVAAVGVANQASGDPYTAFPRMAAMAAMMAALGFAVAGSFGGSSVPLPSNKGTGTVLGDPEAVSESITRAIDDLSDIDALTMRYSAQMAASLRNIEGNIGGLAALLIQSGGLEASAAGVKTGFQTDMIGRGFDALDDFTSRIIGTIPVIGGALGGFMKSIGASRFFGASTKIIGQGLAAGAQSVGSILDGGFDASYFTDIEKKKKTFGITTSKKVSTQYSDADPLLERQIGTIFSNYADALMAASSPLGRELEAVESAIRNYVVDIGRIDLRGLSGDEISERLTNVFSAAGDRLASFALGGLEDFQKVGEGYLQTVIRTASGVEEATVSLRRFGVAAIDYQKIANKQGDVGAELVRDSLLAIESLGGVSDILKVIDGDASEIAQAYKDLTDARLSLQLLGFSAQAIGFDLIQGAGGLDNLADSLKAFEEGFLSESAQLEVQSKRMAAQFQLLGLSLPTSGDAFAALVRGIDTSTAAGRELLGNVLNLSGGFSDLLDALEKVGSGIESEIERIRGLVEEQSGASLAELQARFGIKTAQARAGDQAAIDALPKLSQAILAAAEASASSGAELAVIQMQTLASLEATLAVVRSTNRGAVPAFASGGDFAGGWRLVGERGPELEATGAARIFDAGETARILSGGTSARDEVLLALVAEVKALRQDTRAQAAVLAANTGRTARILEGVTQDGDALTVTTAT